MTITASEREALERAINYLQGKPNPKITPERALELTRSLSALAERAAGEPVAHAYDPQAKCNRSVYNPTLGGIHRDCALQLGHTGDCRFQQWRKNSEYVQIDFVHQLERELAASQRRVAFLEKALRDLLDHFLWRYVRIMKGGEERDLPPQIIAANAALAISTKP